MGDVIRTHIFALRRREVEHAEIARQERERLAIMEATKCCVLITTGSHPEDDTHLCLRPKDHPGYHVDKITGFTWKWKTT